MNRHPGMTAVKRARHRKGGAPTRRKWREPARSPGRTPPRMDRAPAAIPRRGKIRAETAQIPA